MRNERGSLWTKWDLHVHTPASLANNQYGAGAEAWEAFFADVEQLPSEFKVLGINDYIFLDGYRKVLEARTGGRMSNIDLVLPVVELRLSAFGGVKNKLSRVNFHVVFSDEIGADLIEAQFLNGLSRHYRISPEHEHVQREWRALPTRESIAELGRLIKAGVPEGRLHEYGSDLQEGFNNLNFNLEDVLQLLQSHYFTGKHLRGVGKTEWADIKWTDNTIADKKTIISSADFVFVAAEDPAAWEAAHRSLTESRVNTYLFDCSDAHALSTSGVKDRIGNCFTWIKADTTFEGLQHALKEFDQRVFVGVEPPLRRRVREHGSRFIDRVEIRRVAGSPPREVWFDNNVECNPGLIAIIGNKGNGKSALAETIALVGNTRQAEHFSFLSPKKFRQRSGNKAANFEGILAWCDGELARQPLDADTNPNEPERVQFIPQNFLENLCNEVPRGEVTDFDRELSRVIFEHVDRTERLGQDTLEEILELKTSAAEEALRDLRRDLHETNAEIVDLENKSTDAYRQGLRTQLLELRRSLNDLRRARPSSVPEPTEGAASAETLRAIEDSRGEQAGIRSEIERARAELAETNRALTTLSNFATALDTFERARDRLQQEYSAALEDLELQFDRVVSVTVDRHLLQVTRNRHQEQQTLLQARLDPELAEGLPRRLDAASERVEALQAELDAPQRAYRAYLDAAARWREQQAELIGSQELPGTALYYRAQIRAISRIPVDVGVLRQQRADQALQIHARLLGLVSEYRGLYRPIQRFVDEHPVSGAVGLRFSAGLVDSGFEAEFLDMISKRVASPFAAAVEGDVALRELLSRYDLTNPEEAISFVEEVHTLLHTDPRSPTPLVDLQALLRKGRSVVDLYNFIFGFSYLEPRYTLMFGDKHLHELSPGEKGTVLLIFYLLVDQSEGPLVIDQPEDNLDNQTVFKVLVPAIREARNRRQIFLVTHNPNLAVVCDADQVIACSIEKERGYAVVYEAGALENPAINRRVVDVLEGTRPAFDNRGSKYQSQVA